MLRPDLARVLDGLLAASEDDRTLTLDAIGDALGAVLASGDDVDALFTSLEAQGRTILAPERVDLPARLRQVVTAARELESRLGRRPRLDELAGTTGLDVAEVRHALAFARVLGR